MRNVGLILGSTFAFLSRFFKLRNVHGQVDVYGDWKARTTTLQSRLKRKKNRVFQKVKRKCSAVSGFGSISSNIRGEVRRRPHAFLPPDVTARPQGRLPVAHNGFRKKSRCWDPDVRSRTALLQISRTRKWRLGSTHCTISIMGVVPRTCLVIVSCGNIFYFIFIF